MARLVFYHHPQAENFSLKYSTTSLAEIRSQRERSNESTKIIRYPFETPIYVLYEGDSAFESAEEIDFDQEWLSGRIRDLPRAGQVVAFRLVELLEAAVDVRDGDEFRLYKEFEPQKIQQALDHVSWGAPLPNVAGEVMSNLILRHSLPNANHRTGIAMLQFCIESVEPGFEIPRTHVDDDTWQEWVDPYIVDSKRLITVRRNNLRFKQLEELDVDLVERKGGIQIRLSDFELDIHWREALTEYAKQHESHCTDFARAILQRAGWNDLLDRQGPTKQEFIKYLEEGLVERDFREMFRSVAKLGDRLTDLTNVFTPLKVKFFSEVINCLFKAHTGKKTVKPYKSSADRGYPELSDSEKTDLPEMKNRGTRLLFS